MVKKAVTQYISELVNDKIKIALNSNETDDDATTDAPDSKAEEVSDGIITTAEEMQAFYIVKSILGSDVELNRVTYKDTYSYFSILLDGKVTRWICRVFLKENVRYIIIPNEDSQEKYLIDDVSDIYNLAPNLKNRLSELLK